MKLSIFIPVYREKATVRALLDKVREADLSALGLAQETIIVDDGSADGTVEILHEYLREHPEFGATLIELAYNHGKGYAVQQALAVATGEICVIQDADLEYDPRDWPALLEPLAKGEASVVYGSRQLPLGPDQRRRRLYQIGLTIAYLAFRVLYGVRLTDIATCYKAMRTDLLRRLEPECRRFAFDVEISCKLVNRRIPIVERPISYRPRYKSDGKKIRWRDFFTSMAAIFYYRFFDRGR